MSVHCSSKQIQYGIRQSTLQEMGSSVCEIFAEKSLMYSFLEVQYLCVHLYLGMGRECIQVSACTRLCAFTLQSGSLPQMSRVC